MSKYETIVVFDANLPPDAIDRESKKIEALLSQNGKVVSIDVWGKKHMAYPINKKTLGFYVLFVFEYDGNAGKFIENNFKFNENIIRYLTVAHEDVKIFAAGRNVSESAAAVEDVPTLGGGLDDEDEDIDEEDVEEGEE